ncbi:hypothetical protein LXL04_001022 [Taraxacum kok-saghyz]
MGLPEIGGVLWKKHGHFPLACPTGSKALPKHSNWTIAALRPSTLHRPSFHRRFFIAVPACVDSIPAIAFRRQHPGDSTGKAVPRQHPFCRHPLHQRRQSAAPPASFFLLKSDPLHRCNRSCCHFRQLNSSVRRLSRRFLGNSAHPGEFSVLIFGPSTAQVLPCQPRLRRHLLPSLLSRSDLLLPLVFLLLPLDSAFKIHRYPTRSSSASTVTQNVLFLKKLGLEKKKQLQQAQKMKAIEEETQIQEAIILIRIV